MHWNSFVFGIIYGALLGMLYILLIHFVSVRNHAADVCAPYQPLVISYKTGEYRCMTKEP